MLAIQPTSGKMWIRATRNFYWGNALRTVGEVLELSIADGRMLMASGKAEETTEPVKEQPKEQPRRRAE